MENKTNKVCLVYFIIGPVCGDIGLNTDDWTINLQWNIYDKKLEAKMTHIERESAMNT